MKNHHKTRIYSFGRFIIAFVLVLVLVITFPFITSFVYLFSLIWGEPVSYLAGGIVSNLYVPLILILIIMGLNFAFLFLRLNVNINTSLFGTTGFKRRKPIIKDLCLC